TSRWLPDEVVLDRYTLQLPADLPPGDYPLEVGLYISETGRRLAVQSADGTASDAVQLQPLPLP
ncbi:MAG: hypothetical protein ACK2U0_13640, partial [Candidatus Promineifilaceae bacterium]